MNKKYELTKETKTFNGKTLYRIRALKDFSDVTKGDLGGCVEREHNLSHEGDCWIYDNGCVLDNGYVSDYGRVSDYGLVLGNGLVSDYGWVSDNGCVTDNGCVLGNEVLSTTFCTKERLCYFKSDFVILPQNANSPFSFSG